VTAILVTVAVLVGVAAVVLVLGSRERTPKRKPTSNPIARPRRPAGGPKPKVKKAPRSAFQKAPLWLRVLPILLLIGAVVSLGFALTKFRLGKTERGPIVILAIDTSLSMDKNDVLPSRLAAAETAAKSFVAQVPAGFRVGLVTFAKAPTLVVAPTTDHTQVSSQLGQLPRGKGTVIGDGLTEALNAIQADWDANGKTNAAVILLSDGVDIGSEVKPLDAADRASSMGVPVHTVVLGTPTTEGGDADASLLQDIATTTHATSSNAKTATQLDTVYKGLGTTLSTQLKISSSAQLFVLLAVLLAMGAAVLVLLTNRSQY
jgi:Ca-activated chloride channel family protein